jgi:AcrR family transcriptional regulator
VSRTRDVDERRFEILEATCAVVAERGFGHTRIVDVATRLGMSSGVIHYHFESKDLLLAAAFAHAAQRDLDRLQAALASAGTPLEQLRRLVALSLPGDGASSWGLWIDAWGEGLRNPVLQQTGQQLDAAWKAQFESVVRAGVADGCFRTPDPHGSAWRIAALIDGLSVHVVVHPGAIQRREAHDWAMAAAASELGVRPGVLRRTPPPLPGR